MKKMENKVAVIPGGNSGIGLAIAHEFVNQGAKAAIMGRDESSLAAAKDSIDGDCLTIQGDVQNLPDLDRLLVETSAMFGKIDTVVVNAKGFAGTSVYSASKAAVRSFARTMTTELAPRNIRVNVISPGPIETPIFARLGMPEEDLAVMKDGFVSMVPLGRMGRPEEIATTALFLASDDASYITGADIAVDGGAAQV